MNTITNLQGHNSAFISKFNRSMNNIPQTNTTSNIEGDAFVPSFKAKASLVEKTTKKNEHKIKDFALLAGSFLSVIFSRFDKIKDENEVANAEGFYNIKPGKDGNYTTKQKNETPFEIAMVLNPQLAKDLKNFSDDGKKLSPASILKITEFNQNKTSKDAFELAKFLAFKDSEENESYDDVNKAATTFFVTENGTYCKRDTLSQTLFAQSIKNKNPELFDKLYQSSYNAYLNDLTPHVTKRYNDKDISKIINIHKSSPNKDFIEKLAFNNDLVFSADEIEKLANFNDKNDIDYEHIEKYKMVSNTEAIEKISKLFSCIAKHIDNIPVKPSEIIDTFKKHPQITAKLLMNHKIYDADEINTIAPIISEDNDFNYLLEAYKDNDIRNNLSDFNKQALEMNPYLENIDSNLSNSQKAKLRIDLYKAYGDKPIADDLERIAEDNRLPDSKEVLMELMFLYRKYPTVTDKMIELNKNPLSKCFNIQNW